MGKIHPFSIRTAGYPVSNISLVERVFPGLKAPGRYRKGEQHSYFFLISHKKVRLMRQKNIYIVIVSPDAEQKQPLFIKRLGNTETETFSCGAANHKPRVRTANNNS